MWLRIGARAASCVFLTKTQEQEGGSTLCRLRRGDRVVLRKRATVLYVVMKVVGQIFQDVVVGAAQRLSYLPGNPLVLVFLRAGGRRRAVDADVLVAMTCVKINRCVGGTRQFFTKSFPGDEAVPARAGGERAVNFF